MSVNVKSDAERIGVLEYQMAELMLQSDRIETKLDELLQLKSKGMGAFWLASTLLGTGVIGIVVALVSWMRG